MLYVKKVRRIRIIYLHGLGSSPRSKKGMLISDEVRKQGGTCLIPDLNIPSFATLSPAKIMTFITDLVENEGEQPLAIIGSSFGGLLAVKLIQTLSHSAAKYIERLVLLAPALDPWDKESGLLNEERLLRWQREGKFPLFDYGSGKEIEVHYGFVQELKSFDSYSSEITIPTLIVHGRQDQIVSYRQSERMMNFLRNGELRLIDDTHELLSDPLTTIKGSVDFCFEGSE